MGETGREGVVKGSTLLFQLHSHPALCLFPSYQSLESLTECCESALSLLGDALQTMDSEPLPDCIKVGLASSHHGQSENSGLAL